MSISSPVRFGLALVHVSPGSRELDVTNFEEIYDNCAKLVWRTVVRLGVAANAVEDVVQDVFLVVHRRLPEFRKGSIARTWVYGITIRVVRNYRRTQLRRRRVGLAGDSAIEPAWLPDRADRAPDALVARAQAAALVQRLLGELYDELREVFVLSELEEMTAHEIGQALGVSPNTVYSRLRAARQAFDQALARARARDEWRIR